MNHIADGAQPFPIQEPSAGVLVKQLSEQISVLVRGELKLAQLEMTRKGKQAGIGIGMFGGGGLAALYGLGCLIACVIIAISGVLAAGIAALMGKRRVQEATPPVPNEAVGSVKTDVEHIKEKAQR